MSDKFSILIAGAGIGGLTASLALARTGARVTVFEQASSFREIGAGLQLSANALAVLDALGLSTQRNGGIEIDKVEIHDGLSGQKIVELPTPNSNRTQVIARPDLQSILLQAVGREPNIKIYTDARVMDVLGGKHLVSATLDNGTMESGDVLIGADGVWSQTRRFVNTARPEFSGRIAWRATLPLSAVPVGISRHTVSLWLAPNTHVVTYPISNGAYFNAVAITQGNWSSEDWSTIGNTAELAAEFKNWADPIQQLISTADQWLKWALCTIDPSVNWINDRIALMGDAAHAMVPFMAQGAGMSIEDAWCLAGHLAKAESSQAIPDALKQYQAQRQDRATKVWQTSKQQGKIYHLAGPMRLARNAVMRAGGQILQNRYNWIYDWRP